MATLVTNVELRISAKKTRCFATVSVRRQSFLTSIRSLDNHCAGTSRVSSIIYPAVTVEVNDVIINEVLHLDIADVPAVVTVDAQSHRGDSADVGTGHRHERQSR